MKPGDRVTHLNDAHKVKCRHRWHGTVTGLEPYRNLPGATVKWDDGHTETHPVANLQHCRGCVA